MASKLRFLLNLIGLSPFYSFVLGYYLYLESSSRAKDDNARLFTEYLPKTTGTCFSFYYHMYGPTTGSLKLHMYPKGSSGLVELFSKSGSQENRWYFQRVDLKSATSYQVR